MSLVPFVVICTLAAGLALMTRRAIRLSLGLGIAGLVLALVAAMLIRPGDAVDIGALRLVATGYSRLFLVLGSAVALLLVALGLATSWQRNVPAAALGGLAGLAVALSLVEPLAAVSATVAAGLAGILVTVVAPITPRDVGVAARLLRAIVVAGGLALLAATWVARPLEELDGAEGSFGLAFLGMALAVAIRFGAIPFHAWAARLSESAPAVALPHLLVWVPAGLAIVALAWVEREISPLGLGHDVERAVIIAVALLTLVLGAFAAWIQDDVVHVAGYSIVQDAGFILLGLAALAPEAWAPARTFILVYVVAKSGLIAWALALRSAFGSGLLYELGGWTRRAPVLAIAFVVIVIASVGAPGLAAWAARSELVAVGLDDPLRTVAWVGGLASLAYYARILAIGLGHSTPVVLAAPGERPRLPVAWAQVLADRRSAGAEAPMPPSETADRGGPARARLTGSAGGRRARAGAHIVARGIGPAWQLNRVPIASGLVLLLSLLAVSVAGGAFDVVAAASAGPPEAGTPGETILPGQTEPPGDVPFESPEPSPPA